MIRKCIPAILTLGTIVMMSCTAFAPIVSPTELDEPLEVLESPDPEYSVLARELGMEGTVVIEVTVRVDGTVQSVEIERSSGYSELDKASKKAVRNWVLTEPRKDGESVRSWVLISFTFTLD